VGVVSRVASRVNRNPQVANQVFIPFKPSFDGCPACARFDVFAVTANSGENAVLAEALGGGHEGKDQVKKTVLGANCLVWHAFILRPA
jgi:hypothetical protein